MTVADAVRIAVAALAGGLTALAIREAVLAGFMRDRFRRMLDEPDARFDGLTPREAARTSRHRPRVERWLRTVENAAAHGVTPGEASRKFLRG